MIHKFILMNPENVKIPDDDTDFWTHPICDMYEVNREGIVRNIKSKNHVGYKEKNGYYRFSCSCCKGEKKIKHYLIHRFIWECYHGLIKDGFVIDHINNIPSDNRLENLQMISQRENSKKNARKGFLLPIRVKAINVKTGETFIYKSINGASKDLHINNRSISHVLSGMTKTALSKKYGEKYTFQKLDKNSEITSTVIIIKNKINLPIHQVRRMIVNNSS